MSDLKFTPVEFATLDPAPEPPSARWRRFTILDIMLLSLIVGINCFVFRGLAKYDPILAILIGSLYSAFWFGPCRIFLQFRRGRTRPLEPGEKLWISQGVVLMLFILVSMLFGLLYSFVPPRLVRRSLWEVFFLCLAWSFGPFVVLYECVLPIFSLIGLYKNLRTRTRAEPDLWTNRLGFVLALSPHWVLLILILDGAL